jgi:hypothetical protein
MANTQVIQLDGIIRDVENVQIQTESSNTILQLSDRYDYAIDPTIAYGLHQLNTKIYVDTLDSSSTIGSHSIIPIVSFSSISPTIEFGDFKINMQIRDVPFPSIESTLVIPDPAMRRPIAPLGISSTNNFGTATFIDNIHRLLVFKNDNISKVGENDAVVIAGGIRINPSSVLSETATSGNATLPSNPVGFMSVNINGRDYLMPYYNA